MLVHQRCSYIRDARASELHLALTFSSLYVARFACGACFFLKLFISLYGTKRKTKRKTMVLYGGYSVCAFRWSYITASFGTGINVTIISDKTTGL